MKLLIVDDAPAVYQRLIDLLGGLERLTAVSVARTIREAVIKCKHFQPDMIVLDIDVPDGFGVRAITAIRSAGTPRARLLVFSNRVEFRTAALQANADGFFDKSMEFDSLVEQIQNFEPAINQSRRSCCTGGSHA